MDMDRELVIILCVLLAFVAAMAITAYVVARTASTTEFETLKVRFAAVTFTGIMVLVLLCAILAIAVRSAESMEVFKTVMTGLTPIAGGIIGYLFASKDTHKRP
jgi:hypothetical protein